MSALLRATDKAIPEQGDGDLSVLSALILAMPPILPCDVLTASNDVKQFSFLSEAQINLGPSAASSQVLCTLAGGLWDININWSGVCGGSSFYSGFKIVLGYQGFSIRLSALQLQSTGVPRDTYIDRRILTRDVATIELVWPVIPAASFLTSEIGLSCTRAL